MPPKPCPSCRAENRAVAVFCCECGGRFSLETEVLIGKAPEPGASAAGGKGSGGERWWPGPQAAGAALGGAALLGLMVFAWWQGARPAKEPARRSVDFAKVESDRLPVPIRPAKPTPLEKPAGGQEKRACLRDREYARRYGEGEAELSAGRYLTALDAYQRALAACADIEAREGVSRAEGKLYEDYMKGGARYEGEREWDGAVASYQNALGYKPGDRAASAGVGRARSRAARAGPSRGGVSGRGGIDWVTIPGGSFMLGSNGGKSDEKPAHRVTVKSFQMAKSEVTRGQYKACVDAGACTPAHVSDGTCYVSVNSVVWIKGTLPTSFQGDDQPAVCVAWHQAKAFSEWAGGRLPTEAEWEYAARSGGQDIEYPWGDESATCARAVMDDGGDGCGHNSTWPVCSKTRGNTRHGLCDMEGNVSEWTQDWYHGSYNGAPSDGTAWERPAGSSRVVRGGSWGDFAGVLRAADRVSLDPGIRFNALGFRPARSP